MSSVAPGLRECPYCKEEIKAEAVKCKHCHSRVAPERPTHGGTCPYCKEEIKAEAVKCKHCHSFVGPPSDDPARGGGCGCHGPSATFPGFPGATASPGLSRPGRPLVLASAGPPAIVPGRAGGPLASMGPSPQLARPRCIFYLCQEVTVCDFGTFPPFCFDILVCVCYLTEPSAGNAPGPELAGLPTL